MFGNPRPRLEIKAAVNMFGKFGGNLHPAIAAAAIAGVFFLFGLVTLDDFGVTWDEPDHFAAGDIELHRVFDLDIDNSLFRYRAKYYGPIFDIWGAINHQIFTVHLALLPEANARHLHILASGILTIFFTSLLAGQVFSNRVGIFSGLFLAAFPRFVGHSFNNPKDIPLALVFILCLFFFYRRLITGKMGYSLLLLLAGGIGFATRIQYLIAPLLLLILTIVYNSIISRPGKSFWSKMAACWDIPLALLLTIPLGMLFWPYFWTSPLEKFQSMLDFYLRHPVQAQLIIRYFGQDYIPGLTLPWHYVPVMLTVTTPLFTLGSILIGIGAMFRGLIRRRSGEKEKFGAGLVLLWIIIGLLPFMLPGQRVYGGIRHFLFVIPAFCVTAGVGLDFILTRFRGRWRRPARAFAALLFLLLFISTYSYHPYYTIYYNALVGGPRGAFGRFSVENWGNAYQAACRWLNRHAPENSTVLALVAEQIPRWHLRPDITVLGFEAAADPAARYDYSIYILRDIDPLLKPDKEPVFQISVKNQPICNVHQW
jgi:4-amino-4-deoxy-L-arabinose transferase-like glycosyltransferase